MTESTLTYRVGQVEKMIDSLNMKVETILINHLPHIAADLLSLKTRVNVLSVINVGALIIALLVARFL